MMEEPTVARQPVKLEFGSGPTRVVFDSDIVYDKEIPGRRMPYFLVMDKEKGPQLFRLTAKNARALAKWLETKYVPWAESMPARVRR